MYATVDVYLIINKIKHYIQYHFLQARVISIYCTKVTRYYKQSLYFVFFPLFILFLPSCSPFQIFTRYSFEMALNVWIVLELL